MRIHFTACVLPLVALLAACSGGEAGDRSNRGEFQLNRITTGQGQVYPYRIREVDSRGVPTLFPVNIESMDTLRANVTPTNGVMPVGTLPTEAVLPNGAAGNHYLLFEFSHDVDLESVLSPAAESQTTTSGLTTALALIAYNQDNEATATLRGRAFVGGYTYYKTGSVMELVQAVDADDNGNVQILDGRAAGFPRGFVNDEALVSPKSLVFVADTDSNLNTIERFDPADLSLLIRVQVTNAVLSESGSPLTKEVSTATTVGADRFPPEVLGFSASPVIVPGNGQSGVDPLTSIQVSFNKPVQPGEVGTFLSGLNLTPAVGGVGLVTTAASRSIDISYYADPYGTGDFCNYIVTPAYNLPGRGVVTVSIDNELVHSLDGQPVGRATSTTFTTGAGPGIVNAPVSPDAIYVGVGGSDPGVVAIDLNGYGQGTNGLDPNPVTGEPTKEPSQTWFAKNPNIGSPGVVPQLTLGTGPIDAGSNGLLTLVEDTSGNTLLLAEPIVGQVRDVHVGLPLDLAFNNSNINVNAGSQNQTEPVNLVKLPGNGITAVPHPNPPKLVFPPPNFTQGIFGQEPSVTTKGPGPQNALWTQPTSPCIASPVNQLLGGATPRYLQHWQTSVFNGPQPAPAAPPPPPQDCPFASRQQIGHFLYVLDRDNRQVVVLNSNRFTILDVLKFSDPVAISISPNVGILSVANFSSSSISFVNIDPRKAGFHTTVAETRLPNPPTRMAWQPDGEALLVVSTEDSTLSVIKGADFSLETVVSGGMASPIDLCVTIRYTQSGNTSGVYYGYILNRDGSVAVFESGPAGVNGIGYQDMIGTLDQSFRRAKRIKLDYIAASSGFYIAHLDDSNVGMVSRAELTAGPTGPQQINQSGGGFILPPTFRQKTWLVTRSFGGSDPATPLNQRLNGNSPVDVCVDEALNFGGYANQITTFNAKTGKSVIRHSSKGGLLVTPQGGQVNPYIPRLLFVALEDTGRVDVIDLNSNAIIASLRVPGVHSLSSYWKQ